MIAFLLDILVTPIESTIVTIAGSPSGIAATASPTEVINISTADIFLSIPITKIYQYENFPLFHLEFVCGRL